MGIIRVFGGMPIIAPVEVIVGQIVAKANNYLAVPDKTNGGRRIIKNDKIRAYERLFEKQCVKYAGMQINQKFELVVTVYYKSEIYDLDNSIKTLMDCLQYVGAITNDNLCSRITADKRIDSSRPRVEFAIISPPPPKSLFED